MSHVAKTTPGRSFQSFRKLQSSKHFLPHKRITLFSVEICSSQSAERCRRGTTFSFNNTLFSKSFMHSRGGPTVLSKLFRLTLSKFFVRETFCVSKKFWFRKLSSKGVRHQHFVENIFSHRTDKLRKENPLCFNINLVSTLFMHRRGPLRLFRFCFD